MSGSWTVSNLEEVFLSDEFARSGGSGGQVEFTDGHSGHAPPFGQPHEDHRSDEGPEESRLDMTHKPLATVLAFAPGTPAGRQRAIAAMGGVAATVLVVVGLTSGVPQGPGSGQRSDALARAGHHGNPLLPPADTPPSRVRVPNRCTRRAGRRPHAAARRAVPTRQRECAVRSPFSTAPRRAARRRRGRAGCHQVALRSHLRCRLHRPLLHRIP